MIRYEESATGSGEREEAYVNGYWEHCPSHALMHEQVEHNGIKRGSRIVQRGFGAGTVLSCYRFIANDGNAYVNVCVAFDRRRGRYDRQDMPIDKVKLV